MTNPFAEWRIDEADYPHAGAAEDRMRFLLGYAILAPSGHNTQPWLFRLSPDGVDLIADRTRCLPVVDPFDRALVISCGAALGHLRTAMRFFGHEPVIQLLPEPADPDLLARVIFGSPVAPGDADVERFRSITRRRTTRLRYPEEPLPQGLASRLKSDAEAEGCVLSIIDDKQRASRRSRASWRRATGCSSAIRRSGASWRPGFIPGAPPPATACRGLHLACRTCFRPWVVSSSGLSTWAMG